MAIPNFKLIAALEKTVAKLSQGATYQWGHMGACNCGNLAQELTTYTKAEIHQYALANGRGDWNEQLNDYCPTSGLPMDMLMSEMLNAGLSTSDLKHLERLSDPTVLQRLPAEKRYPRHNFRDDVVLYINAWASMLEDELVASVKLPSLEATSVVYQ
ncbi:MAG: hypothetical protein EAZ80_02735 [Runella slithyformis]|nr:MAG: hypothetical protein EAZ80_02735 [Runella slithyformis]